MTDLRDLLRDCQDADHAVIAATTSRREAIHAAHDAGATLRDIAGVVTMSVETVRKVCQEDY